MRVLEKRREAAYRRPTCGSAHGGGMLPLCHQGVKRASKTGAEAVAQKAPACIFEK